MSRRHLAMLLVLAALWGASFMFIKIGDRRAAADHARRLPDGPRRADARSDRAHQRAAQEGRCASFRGAARPLAVTGLLNSAIPIFAITWAETRLDSGLTAIIQASAPLFTALLALRFSHDQRVRGSRLAGLVVGFAGVRCWWEAGRAGRSRRRSRSSSRPSATREQASRGPSGWAGSRRS